MTPGGGCRFPVEGTVHGEADRGWWGAEGPGVSAFHVYLRPDNRDTEYAVYEVKGQVYDRYPDAYLDVVVLEAFDALLTNGDTSA